jgi:hypothetical protein
MEKIWVFSGNMNSLRVMENSSKSRSSYWISTVYFLPAKHRKPRRNIHKSSGIRTHDPNIGALRSWTTLAARPLCSAKKEFVQKNKDFIFIWSLYMAVLALSKQNETLKMEAVRSIETLDLSTSPHDVTTPKTHSAISPPWEPRISNGRLSLQCNVLRRAFLGVWEGLSSNLERKIDYSYSGFSYCPSYPSGKCWDRI